MQDLVERAEEALELALRLGAEAAEVFVIDAPTDAVLFEPGEGGQPAGAPGVRLRTAVTVPHRGLGLATRWPDSRVGFGSTTDLTSRGISEAVEAGRASALPEEPPLPLASPAPEATPGGGPIPADGPTPAASPTPALADHRILEMNLPDLVAFGREVANEALDAGVGVLGVLATAVCRRVAVANTAGLMRSSLDTLVTAQAYAASPRAGMAGWSRSARSMAAIRAHAVGRKAAEEAIAAEGARGVPSGRQVVVLRPEAVFSLLASSLAPALGADRILAGLSPLGRPSSSDGHRHQPRIDEPVAADVLSIADDATYPGATGSYAFDAEGTTGGRTGLIEGGRLVGVLHNNLSGERTRRLPGWPDRPVGTGGNASRDHSGRMRTFVEPAGEFGYRAGIGPSNLVITAPGATFDDPAGVGVDCGLLVADVMGAFVIDPAVGDFSVTTTNAWVLENGRPAYPVHRAMLTGNVYDLLGRVMALAGEPVDVRGQFSVLTPGWVVDGLTVV